LTSVSLILYASARTEYANIHTDGSAAHLLAMGFEAAFTAFEDFERNV